VAATLPAPGAAAANAELFDYHREGLTELALRLIDYTQQQRHPYFRIFDRSVGTLTKAKDTIVRARQCARLFDGYYSNPRKYNRVDAQVELRYLQAELLNLCEWLKPSL
jgi:hypothetical protein